MHFAASTTVIERSQPKVHLYVSYLCPAALLKELKSCELDLAKCTSLGTFAFFNKPDSIASRMSAND